jgi:hypothetical protein
MTIQEVKQQTQETAPYFFSSDTMRFFGQTLRSFKVYKQPDGRYKITAPMKDKQTGKIMGETIRYFNPITKKLDLN